MTRPRMVPARDEDGEPIACEVCGGTGIAASGPVENSCSRCFGTGSQMEPAEREDKAGPGARPGEGR